jgi:Na+-translocating ferredoxin:NAD+ oxidoreductase subunit C
MKQANSKFNFDTIVRPAPGRFHGGIHPAEFKNLSNQRPIATLDAPPQLILPLRQNSGKTGEIIVSPGEQVHAGQLLANKRPGISANLHAPLAGDVISTEARYTGHVSGLKSPAITLAVTQYSANQLSPVFKPLHWQSNSAPELLARIESAGIVGLGGAMFPTSVKQAAMGVDTLIVNAMECEPYITCDDRMLRELTLQVIEGAQIAAKIASAKTIIFAIEDNKTEAIISLQSAIEQIGVESPQYPTPMSVVVAPTRYPSGGEKQTIELVTGKQLPAGSLPSTLGLLIQNVGTLHAIYEAITLGNALTRRLVTITGNLVETPGNYWVYLGTPIDFIMQHFGVSANECEQVIIGGPLMGQSVNDFCVPVTKATNCLIFNRPDERDKLWLTQATQHRACIRCGECEKVCPAELIPQQLLWFSQSEQWENITRQGLHDCIECGACAYVCPSEIPLVHYYRYAKSSIKKLKQDKDKSEIARQRFEFREQRLARAKAERALKHQQAAEARRQAAADANDLSGKQTAINEALRRVKEKKQAQGIDSDDQGTD